MIILSSFYLIIIFFKYFTGTNALKCLHKPPTSEIYGNNNFGNEAKISRVKGEESNDVTKCTSYCYSVWRYDPDDLFNTSRYQLISSGCSDNGNNSFNCNKLQCTSKTLETSISNNTIFCCCYGDMCNTNYSINLIDLDSNDEFRGDYQDYMFFLIFVCILFTLFTIISAKFARAFHVNNNKRITTQHKTTDSLHLLESHSQSSVVKSNNYSKDYMENLIFIEIIGRGKYGNIWKGKLNDTTVAAKVCLELNKHLWTNECLIYSLPFMNHPNLPNFYRNIERVTETGHLEQCLVIEYGHYGSLQSYLTEHTFDWSRMCQLYKSLVQGLAYLHTEIRKDGKVKPSIAHCDLCSANIIVKADGTCMICDFQFAVFFINGINSPNTMEEKSSTIRYLAPEILDGAINLRKSESSLKQADVYSLGLILWEIATRCSDLYQGIDVPRYKLPFEHEIGLTPSLDQMKLLVNRHKARPLFPDIWKDSNYAIRLLKETISECWDHEPEARLTALCIEERISELPSLWKRHKMETLSSCYVIAFLQEHSKNLPGSTKPECDFSEKENITKSYPLNDKYSNVCYINKFENSLHGKYNDHKHLLHHPQHKHYFHQISLNNTKKHHLNINIEKNYNINLKNSQPKLTLPLQPHHARNPCMERNLMINESDERDEILEQGLKFKNSNNTAINFDASNLNESESNDTHNGDLNYSENRSLIQTPMPIPFVQNYVSYNNGEGSPTIKIKDINKYRNSPDTRRSWIFKQNIINYLKKKFSLDLFKSSTNQSNSYHNCDDKKYNKTDNGTNLLLDRANVNNPKNNEANSNNDRRVNSSSTMISLDDNYPFSICESYGKNDKKLLSSIVQEQKLDKLNNHHSFHCSSGKLDQENHIVNNNESNQPKLQIVE